MEIVYKVFKLIDRIILLPTYSAGEKNNSYDSSFLYHKISSKNKFLLKSITKINDILQKTDFDNSVLVLQGAGDVKNITNVLKKKMFIGKNYLLKRSQLLD